MRRGLSRLVALAAVSALVLGSGLPAKAEDPKKFESTLAAPAGGGGHSLASELACPGPGAADGTSYRWIDLKGGYTHFKLTGPPHLFNQPAPVHDANDYDMDMFVFDDKCKQIGEGATPAGGEKTSTKRPARFVLVDYFLGVQPNLKFTLLVSNSPIK